MPTLGAAQRSEWSAISPGLNPIDHIKSAKGTCKQFLIDSMQRNKDEIEIIRTEFDELKSKVDSRKRKVSDIMAACENFLINVLEKRNSEISTLTTYISDMHYIKVSEFYLHCIQHFSNATERRNLEINEIEVLTEPLKARDEELDQEVLFAIFVKFYLQLVSSAIDEALCEAFGIQQGMTFFKIQDERTEIRVARVDSEDCHATGSDVVQSGRPIFDDFSNICGRISAITRRMLSSKWSSVCGLSA
ncbi:hexokinase_2 domain-containing protein [Trichonephila clavipes]|nr:hexokinase_2 domain-containing protein [Trichonephila clavipes]